MRPHQPTMDYEQLTTAIQSLDRDALVALRRAVSHRLSVLECVKGGIAPEAVVRTAVEVCGLDALTSRRKEAEVRARMIAALRLQRAGMRAPNIAPYIGRGRCDTYHLLAQMELALVYPSMYPREVRAWEALLEQYPL